MRTIHLTINMDDFDYANNPQLFNALGYLSTWCNDTYDHVNIYPDSSCGKHSMIAYYCNENKETKYVIGAVWSEKEQSYSFHS